MQKILAILLLPFILASCNGFGPKKVKNIVELTPRLTVETNEPLYLDPGKNIYSFDPAALIKNKQYSFTKNRTVVAPIFIDDVIYALDIRANISAFSKSQNKITWLYDLSKNKKDNYIGGGILHHNGKLYVTYGSRSLVVLDLKSGYEIIRKELPDIVRIKPVMIGDNTVLVQTISNQVIALDTKTLSVIWQHEEGGLEALTCSYAVTPIVYSDRVIVTYNSGQVLAINSKDGAVLWHFELNNVDHIAIPNFEERGVLCTPANDNTHLYIASGLGHLIKLSVATGAVVWQVDASDIQSMSLIGNNLFVTNNARQVAAFNPESGKVKFTADLNDIKDIKKLKAATFLAPLFGQNSTGQNSLNIISANGVLYSFDVDQSNHLSIAPTITKIIRNIRYYGLDNNGNMYFSTDRKIMFGFNKVKH